MSYPGWSPPSKEGMEKNALREPEGERIRAELMDFLRRNKICGAIIETPLHFVRIDIGKKLPNEIRSVLSYHGGMHVVVSDDVDWDEDAKEPLHT